MTVVRRGRWVIHGARLTVVLTTNNQIRIFKYFVTKPLSKVVSTRATLTGYQDTVGVVRCDDTIACHTYHYER
jgi:hypothetical protein